MREIFVYDFVETKLLYTCGSSFHCVLKTWIPSYFILSLMNRAHVVLHNVAF